MRKASSFSFGNFANAVNHPSITIAAVVLGFGLGITRLPFLQYLQPVGDFYIAMLQMCVLPFLLATIPLAVRSALASGTGGKVVITANARNTVNIADPIAYFDTGNFADLAPAINVSIAVYDDGGNQMFAKTWTNVAALVSDIAALP